MTDAAGIVVRRRRILAAVAVLAGLAVVILACIPPANGTTRVSTLANAILAVGLGLHLGWRWRTVRILAALLAVFLFAVLLLPARGPDVEALRTRYCERLQAHLGTRYVWGGEGVYGLDCSGLMRRAFIEANLLEGFSRADMGPVRLAAWLWWNDQSARCLRDGGLGTVVPVGAAGRLADVTPEQVLPGDLAVTRDGVHVLATLGGGRWIQASPSRERVIVVGRGDDDPWLTYPVRLLRWRALQASPGH